MNKHTPGPWKYSRGKYGYQIWQDVKKNFGNHWIANLKCESCPADELANACLIASAPQLLEALESLSKACADECIWDEFDIFQAPYYAAIAAISKARGES